MDHLIKPFRPVGELPRVKYICFTEYDRGDFFSYPSRVGWSDEDVFNPGRWNSHISSGRRALTEMQSFLQCWLFFGTLHAFFGNAVRWDDFITKATDGSLYIYTGNLVKIADSFVKQQRTHGVHADTASARFRILTTADRVRDAISSTKDNGLDSDLVLSFGLLLKFLSSMHEFICSWSPITMPFVRDIFAPAPSCNIPQQLERIRGGHATQFLDHIQVMLIGSGWCPRLVSHVYASWNIEFLLFLLLLGPPDRKAHSNCDFVECSAYQINPSRYVHSHARRGCQCKHVPVDSTQMCAILQAGRIPVVRIDNLQEGAPLVVDAAEHTPYVAISHVWSDGLGNPGQNSIALCQLRRICRIVSMLPTQPVAIWVDTLCCPVQPLSMRKLAIQMMRRTYEEADVVVVLDSRLTPVNIKNLSTIEITARIMTSAWTKRLWTWQEGALAKTLYFAFRDRLFHFDELQTAFLDLESDDWALQNNQYQYEDDLYTFDASLSTATVPTLYNIVYALSGRKTSVATDEALCLASIADLSLGRILEKRPEDRMLGFWEVFPEIPTYVIFWEGPRLENPGFRWAPKTPLRDNYRMTWQPGTNGTLSSRGLLVECPGALLFNAVDHRVNSGFWVRDEAGRCPFYVLKGWIHEASISEDGIPFERPLDTSAYTHVAMLFDRGLVERDYDEQLHPDTERVRITLAYVYHSEDGVIYARRSNSGIMVGSATALYSRILAVDTLDGGTDNSADGSTRNILVDGAYHAIEWKVLPDDQRWCID